MKIEEAIGHIQDVICENNSPNITIFKLEKEALYMAVDALKKQLAKKPVYECCVCPSCGNEVKFSIHHNYCTECGQKLDWSGEEEEE